MDIQLLVSFLAASLILAITPGPDLLLLGSITTASGLRNGIRCSVGIFLSGLILTFAVALGLGNLFEAMPGAAYFVRIIGAIYFFWLAIQYLCSSRHKKNQLNNSFEPVPQSAALAPELVGLLNNLLNPKALLFFGLFLPQFVSPAGWSATLQLLLLGFMLSLTALVINIIVCFMAAHARSKIETRSLKPAMLERLAGMIFLILAYRMARTPVTA